MPGLEAMPASLGQRAETAANVTLRTLGPRYKRVETKDQGWWDFYIELDKLQSPYAQLLWDGQLLLLP
jgi:hypothetical protein